MKDSQAALPVRLCSCQESGALGRQDRALKPGPPCMETACLGSLCPVLWPGSGAPSCWRRHLWCVFEVILPFPPKPGPATHTHACAQTHMRARTHTCTDACMCPPHVPPCAQTHTCTHTHTHTPPPCTLLLITREVGRFHGSPEASAPCAHAAPTPGLGRPPMSVVPPSSGQQRGRRQAAQGVHVIRWLVSYTNPLQLTRAYSVTERSFSPRWSPHLEAVSNAQWGLLQAAISVGG